MNLPRAAVRTACSCLVAGIAAPAGAQADAELTTFRAAFEAATGARPGIAIALLDGKEPVVLCSGGEARGPALTPFTPLPVGALARLLVADALSIRHKDKLDVASGIRIGKRELTVRELLAGTAALPDCWSWDGSAGVEAQALIACAEAAAEAEMRFTTSSSGMGETLLLEAFAFGAQPTDWPALLRGTLAPHVPGFAPESAERLAEAELALLPEGARAAQRAQPAALRLLVSAKELAAWWQWRMRRGLPLWTGCRSGMTDSTRGLKRWSFRVTDEPVPGIACAYQDENASFLYFGPAEAQGRLADAFEADLLGRLGGPRVIGWVGFRFALDAGVGPEDQPLAPLVQHSWRAAATARDAVRLTLDVSEARSVRVALQGKGWQLSGLMEQGHGVVTMLQPDRDGVGGTLLLVPRPSFQDPRRLTAVWVESHGPLASIPHRFDLELEGK